MKRFLTISCILVGAMICPYGQGEISTSIVWEIDGPDEPRSPATHLLDLDGRILVGSGGKRILEYTQNGQPVSTLVNAGGQDIGGFRDIEIIDNNLLVHAWEPDYGISVAKYDDEGHSLFYADVTHGQSGAGSILDVEGDLVMAWASNCCGTGQTWDTELKRFNGHSANMIWNTDLCYACNSSLGCCSHGLDYPQQVALHNGNLYVFKENVTDPYFSQIGVQKVNLQGQIVLDIILDDYRDFMKAVPHADGILVSGNLGDTPHRIPFVSNMNDEGQELWTVTAPNVQNASPADLIALDNGTFLFVYFEGSTFYFSEITADGDLLNTSSLEVNHPIMELEFTHEMGAHIIQLSEAEFMLAYNHGTWYDDTHFSLVRFTRSEIEAAERNGGVIQMDGINDYASFTLPAGWGESSFSVSFSCTIEDFGTSTEIDGSHYLFGHGLTHQNGDIGFKAQLHPENHTVMWGFSDDDGDGVLEIHLPPELDLNTWYAFTLVVDRDNGTIQAYIDGEAIIEESIPSNLGNLESGLPVALGAFVYPPSSDYRHFHEGAFADVHFFPAALTASQVDSLIQQCANPTILGSEHWGVNNDQYVNLITMEPSVVSGGVIMNGIGPCQTQCAMTDTEQLPCTSIPNHIPTDGLIAFYPFDGNAHDESGNEHNGIITGATFTEDRTGLSNAAIEFLGSTVPGTNRTQVAVDNHVLIPNFNDPFDDGLSISLWVLEYPTSESAFLQRRDNNNIDFVFSTNTDDQLYVHLGFTDFNSIDILENEQWTHVTATYDEQKVRLFKNGVLIEEQEAMQSINHFSDDLFIGKYIYYGGLTHHFFFNGKQDDLGIWNRALSQEEISAIYSQTQLNAGCTDPTACNFNEDDENCIPSGCMEEGACNYNPDAQCDGEACDYSCCPGPGCCGEGMHWDTNSQTCVITPPSVAPDAECTVMNLQELASGYQALLAANAELDSLLADCNGTNSTPESNGCNDQNSVNYYDYHYDIVQIGEQCWFAENLQTAQFRNGDTIPVANPDNPLHTIGQSARAAYNYDENNVSISGWIYNGFVAIDNRSVCPSGWSVPTDEDYKDLERFIGMTEEEVNGTSWRGTDQAQKLKSSPNDSPSWNGTNTTGFSAIPAGVHFSTFSGGNQSLHLWCRDGLGWNSDNYYRAIESGGGIFRLTHNIADGHSIRCLKD